MKRGHNLKYANPPRYRDYLKRHEQKFSSDPCINEMQFREITNTRCFYCGVEGPNGIDRVDNNKGYSPENCVSACKHCNYVKGNLSFEDFQKWKSRFVHYQSQISSD